MRAVVLSIGSELLRGDIIDTNAAYLTHALSELGFEVERVQQVGDNLDALRDAVSTALAAAEVTVCSGGLGPTQDDLTREAIAAALGETPAVDDDLLAHLRSLFGGMGRRMPERNIKQAWLIPSAQSIPNPNGTAPGWFVRHDGRIIIALPGPPGEMVPMWRDSVQARLEELLPGENAMLSLMTFGLGESAVEERIADVIDWRPDVTIATYAKSAGVEVHITARAGTADEALRLRCEAENRLRERLGENIFGTGEDTLTSVVGKLLEEKHLSLAVMESVTGGSLSSLITDNPGSSGYFLGGIVAYAPTAKAGHGVPVEIMNDHGLISPETAQALAAAARRELASNVGIGVTGIAGIEPVEGKPPGTCFVAVELDSLQEVREIRRPGSREMVKRYVSQCALDLLRRQLLKIEPS